MAPGVPKYDAQFTITDASIGATSKVVVMESGKVATGRVAGDAQWDSISFSALAASGSATVYAMAHPGPVVGKRYAQYTVAVAVIDTGGSTSGKVNVDAQYNAQIITPGYICWRCARRYWTPNPVQYLRSRRLMLVLRTGCVKRCPRM